MNTVAMSISRRPDSVDLRAGQPSTPGANGPRPAGASGRPWIGVFFRCCHVYSRIYRNAAGSAYTGRCPRCSSEVTARVGSGGTQRRIFFAE